MGVGTGANRQWLAQKMNTPRNRGWIVVCVILFLGGLCSAWSNRQTITRTSARMRAAQIAQLQWRTKIATLGKEFLDQWRRREETETAPLKSSGTSDSVGKRSNEFSSLPSVRLGGYAADARLSWGRCFQSLGLTPARISLVCERMARYQAGLENLGGQDLRNRPLSDPRVVEFQRRFGEATREYESDLVALLGRDGFKTFRTAGRRNNSGGRWTILRVESIPAIRPFRPRNHNSSSR